jgi:hypothetical protein
VAELLDGQDAGLDAVEQRVGEEGAAFARVVEAAERVRLDMVNPIRGGAVAGVSRSSHWHCLAAIV